MEGKQFVCSHADGSLVTWQLKPAAQAGEGLASKSPVSIIFPHGKKDKETGKVLTFLFFRIPFGFSYKESDGRAVGEF